MISLKAGLASYLNSLDWSYQNVLNYFIHMVHILSRSFLFRDCEFHIYFVFHLQLIEINFFFKANIEWEYVKVGLNYCIFCLHWDVSWTGKILLLCV